MWAFGIVPLQQWPGRRCDLQQLDAISLRSEVNWLIDGLRRERLQPAIATKPAQV